MSYTTKTWYKVSACDKTTLVPLFDGYVVTGDSVGLYGKMNLSAIYDSSDLVTNKLTGNGGSIDANGKPFDLWYDEDNKLFYDNHSTSDIEYWSVSHKVGDSRSEVIFSIVPLNENPAIATRQQTLLTSSEFPSPYLFISPGCAVDVQARNIDFSQSNSVVFDGSKVFVRTSADLKTLDDLFMVFQQLSESASKIASLEEEVNNLKQFVSQLTSTTP